MTENIEWDWSLKQQKSLSAGKRGAHNDDNNQPNKAGNPNQTVATDGKPLNHSPKQSPIQLFFMLGGHGACFRPQNSPEIEMAGTKHVWNSWQQPPY
jgi:hypothetical protein